MDLSNYSTYQQKIIEEIISCDDGFHSSGSVAELPFAGIASISDEGSEIISRFCQVDVDTTESSYNFELSFSEEQKCWFVKMSTDTDVYNGILQFNVIKNSRGSVAFVILNDNPGKTLEDLTYNIQYSNILILEK